jgi:hypothetical protein
MKRQDRFFQLKAYKPASGRLAGLTMALLCAFGLSLAETANAQWKWRDAQGQVQYSDRPPPQSVPVRDILGKPPGSDTLTVREMGPARSVVTPASAASPPDAATSKAPADVRAAQNQAAARQRQAEADEARRKADEEKLAKQRADNCRRAQDYVRTLESGSRIARMNDKGEREFLDDAQRAGELQRSRELVASECR